jgi:threonine/homoserine/homoserine lactone efflux protein
MTLIIAMCIFSLSMSITSGPVNFICLSSGVNYGFNKTLPFVSGATIGFIILLAAIRLGLGVIANEQSGFLTILKFLGSGFIGYMGIKALLANSSSPVTSKSQIPTFKQGILLQWLNPKAWMACLAGTSAFNVANSPERLMLFISIYFAICYVSISLWALMGDKISQCLAQPQHIKMFNSVMGASLFIVAMLLLFI